MTSAPYARRRAIFSALILSGITKTQRYRRRAATIAKPTPVLPEVGSTIVPPGRSRPVASAASIIATAGRSLTLPPGLRNSSLASRWHDRSRPMRSSRTMGVPPTRSSNEVATSIAAPESVSDSTRTPSIGCAGGASVWSVTGKPARCSSFAASVAVAPPTTLTWRGMRVRMSARSSGLTSPDAARTTWRAWSRRRSGASPSPTMTSTSTARSAPVEARELVGGELQVGSPQAVEDGLRPGRAGDRHDDRRLGQLPRERDLLRRHPVGSRHLVELAVPRTQLARPPDAAERAPREECDSVLGAQLQLVLRAAEPRRELVLHARQLVEDLDRHPDLTDIRVGDAGQLHLALVLQLLQRAHGVLVGHRGVGPVELVEPDRIDTERFEAGVARVPQVLGSTVELPRPVARPVVPALGGDEHGAGVAGPRRERLGDEALVMAGLVEIHAVGVGRVDQRGARVERGVDRPDGLRLVGPALERHGHGAQADGAHLSPRDRPSVHDRHLAAIPGPGSAERGPKRRARTEAQRRPAAPMWQRRPAAPMWQRRPAAPMWQRRTAAPMWQRRPRTCGPTLAPCRTRRAAPSTTPIHTWSRLPTGSSDTPTRACASACTPSTSPQWRPERRRSSTTRARSTPIPSTAPSTRSRSCSARTGGPRVPSSRTTGRAPSTCSGSPASSCSTRSPTRSCSGPSIAMTSSTPTASHAPTTAPSSTSAAPTAASCPWATCRSPTSSRPPRWRSRPSTSAARR